MNHVSRAAPRAGQPCAVHPGSLLKVEDARIVYGLVFFRAGEFDVAARLFPDAAAYVLGGCFGAGYGDFRKVVFCEECRHARRRWIEHDAPADPSYPREGDPCAAHPGERLRADATMTIADIPSRVEEMFLGRGFPNAFAIATDGRLPSREANSCVVFCPACRRAREEWLAQQPAPDR